MRTTRAPLIALFVALTFPALVSGCGADLGECPADSAAQQAQGLEILTTRCMNCHSSQVQGSARLGAPEDLNFDDSGTVSDEAGEMWGEVEEGAMPPGGGLSEADRELLRIYLACNYGD